MESNLVWADICKKWLSDSDFRERFKVNPKGTLLSEFKVNIPEDINVVIHAPTSPFELNLIMPAILDEEEIKTSVVNDGYTTQACTTDAKGGTCWLTPNCPSVMTCSCINTAC